MATTRAATIFGTLVVAAALLVAALPVVMAQSPAAAPGPSLDCTNYLLNMTDCLSYVEADSNTTVPEKACCPELAGLVESQPICLCQLMGSADSFGIQISLSKAFKLPSVCGVSTPPLSKCSAAGYQIRVPTPSEAPGGMSPGGLAPASGNSANSGASGINAASQLSFLLLGLATTASLTTFFF